MGDWEINQVCFCHCKNFVNCRANEKWTDIKLRTGVFVFVQFSERKDAVESFMVAGKKVVKLDQIYFWFSFPFCNCKRFDLLYIGYIFNTEYLCESICTFYKKSNCKETCSHEIQVCLFVWFVFFVQLENFPLKWIFHHYPEKIYKFWPTLGIHGHREVKVLFSPTFLFKMF